MCNQNSNERNGIWRAVGRRLVVTYVFYDRAKPLTHIQSLYYWKCDQ